MTSVFPSYSFADGLSAAANQNSGYSSRPSIPIREKIAEGAKVLKQVPQKISSSDHPAAKLATSWGKRARNGYFAGLVVLTLKEAVRRLSDDNLDLNQENVDKEVTEIEKDWGLWEQSAYNGADGLFLAPWGLLVEWGLVKAIPKLGEEVLGSKILHSFVTGLVLSVGVDVFNKIILTSSLYLIEHPEIEFVSGERGLTNEELKQVTLLQDRKGVSYFTLGLVKGGPVTRSAYKKVWGAMEHIIWQEPDLRWALGFDIAEKSILNGQNLMSLAGFSIGGVTAQKIISDTAKWKAPKRILVAATIGVAFTTLIPDKVLDEFTEGLRSLPVLLHQNRLGNLAEVENTTQLQSIFDSSRKDREALVRTWLAVTKIAAEKVEALVVNQRAVVAKLNEVQTHEDPQTGEVTSADKINYARLLLLQNPSLVSRLQSMKKENESNAIFYRSMMKRNLQSLLVVYNRDIQTLTGYLAHPGLPDPLRVMAIQERSHLLKLGSRFEKLRNSLLFEYNPSDLINAYSPEDYGMARLELSSMVLWGISEDLLLGQ